MTAACGLCHEIIVGPVVVNENDDNTELSAQMFAAEFIKHIHLRHQRKIQSIAQDIQQTVATIAGVLHAQILLKIAVAQDEVAMHALLAVSRMSLHKLIDMALDEPGKPLLMVPADLPASQGLA